MGELVFKEKKCKNLELSNFIDKAFDIDPDIQHYVLQTINDKLSKKYTIAFMEWRIFYQNIERKDKIELKHMAKECREKFINIADLARQPS